MSTDSHLSPTSTFPHDLQAWHAALFPLERQGADSVQMLQVIQLECAGSHDGKRKKVREIKKKKKKKVCLVRCLDYGLLTLGQIDVN